MFITIDDAKIFSTAFGSPAAPCILGIGGWIGSWELWTDPFSMLSGEWHTIAYDHRGSGVTQAPIESISFERLVDDVFAVLDAYGVKRCVLAAESAGALTAFGAALKHPERISGLVIVDGYYYNDIPEDDDPFLMGLISNYAATLDRFIGACVPEPDSDHLKRWGRQILDRAAPAAAIALYRVPGSIDLRADLHRITQPTLILHGELDALVPIAAANELVHTLPNAKLIALPGAGHVPTVTRPQEVARAITAFFGVGRGAADLDGFG
jgi:pimeloyl-ACP methyl ester carboxylesterase